MSSSEQDSVEEESSLSYQGPSEITTTSTTEFSSFSFSSSDSDLPSMPKYTPEERACLHGTFWGLGPEKWRESIDGEDAHGAMTYDLCLHGGNNGKQEPGFISNILAANAYVGSCLGTKTTLEQWRTAHVLACSHMRERKMGCVMTRTQAGQLRRRTHVGFIWVGVDCEFSDQFRREIQEESPTIVRLQRQVCEERRDEYTQETKARKKKRGTPVYRDDSSSFSYTIFSSSEDEGYKLTLTQFKRKRLKHIFAKKTAKMYHLIRVAERDDELSATEKRMAKLRAIAWLHQIYERLHVGYDGTGRTNSLFLNKHLCEFGFHPVVLDNYNDPDMVSLDQCVDMLEKGMLEWEKHAPQKPVWPAMSKTSKKAKKGSKSGKKKKKEKEKESGKSAGKKQNNDKNGSNNDNNAKKKKKGKKSASTKAAATGKKKKNAKKKNSK